MYNHITLIGHVGQNPTARYSDKDKKAVRFSLAVKEYSSKDEDKTLWIDCEAWNGLADTVLSTITKGREVAINGRLAIFKYNKEVKGETVQMVKPYIRLTGFHLCGPKPTALDESQPGADAKQKRLAAV